ncbi:MAG: polar amino acid transport system substrate-binding protein [Erysipelotrichaceae bacterium]|nr:MAG: polar amino acid transport system substrate-binding [Erysipelotrichaceae bacterium]TXT18176.1 MAG: polar amino acid transport system substrate-binding protein [Erysipelotrichaceae bacterium]
MLKKYLSLGLVLFLLVGCSSASSSDKSLKDVLTRDKLVIGFTEYPPMGFKENGVVTGFDIEIAKEVCKRLGVEAIFQYIDWDSKVMELSNKNIDAIWNGLTITTAREKEILFSKPYFNNRIVIMTKSDKTFDTIASLSGLKVGVELASSGQEALEKSTVFSTLNEMVKFTSISEAVLDLNAGNIDAIVADEIFARYAISKSADGYRVATEVFNSENYGIGFRLKDIALRDKVDKIIDEMIKDGTAAEISNDWFGEDLLKR